MLSPYIEQLKDLEKRSSGYVIERSDTSSLNQLKKLTEQLEALEREQVELKSAFTNAIEHSEIGFARVSKDGHFISVNPTWCKALKRTQQELKSLKWQDITVEKYINSDAENVEKVINREFEFYTMYKEYYDSDNNVVPLILTVSCVFNKHHELQYFISQAIFLTDQVKKLICNHCELKRIGNART